MMADKESTRLNKFLASRLNIGRRSVDDLITQGRVRVNNQVPELGARVTETDTITLDNKPLPTQHKYVYVLMNKPVGYVCSRRQQGDTPTIYSLLPKVYQHLKSVGRLDKDSSGLLLLTNDGDLTHQLTHPRFAKTKQYEVRINKPLAPLHRQMISDFGVNLPDGKSILKLERLKEGDDHQWRVLMHEGRNRQIRRTFSAFGYQVERLHRTHFGRLSLHELEGEVLKEISRPD